MSISLKGGTIQINMPNGSIVHSEKIDIMGMSVSNEVKLGLLDGSIRLPDHAVELEMDSMQNHIGITIHMDESNLVYIADLKKEPIAVKQRSYKRKIIIT